jgi:hypothetical protein
VTAAELRRRWLVARARAEREHNGETTRERYDRAWSAEAHAYRALREALEAEGGTR